MDKIEFSNRRKQLMSILGEQSMVILPAAPQQYHNKDVPYPYHQDSSFYYLTGFPESQALAVLVPEREQGQYLLFCQEKDQYQETWHGNRVGLEGACAIYGADDAFPIADIDDIIPGLLESCRRLYCSMGYYPEFDEQIIEWLNQLKRRVHSGVVAPTEIIALDYILPEMRLRKTDAEITAIRAAAEITSKALNRAMQFCRPGLYEYEIEAEITHELLRSGCRLSAFPSIVASGKNALTLHYTENNALLKDGELVLIDVGAKLEHYASDVTRTFPINGHFTKPQQAIYEIVLKAQRAALSKLYPSNCWDEPFAAAAEVITKELKSLGLLVGKLTTLLDEEAYQRFYTYHIGHWLGMDVHDPGNYKVNETWRKLEPGMVMTIEPGIYIHPAEDIEEKWWDIGIRIEDNIRITENGYEILTAHLPTTVLEIETCLAKKDF